MFSITYDAGQLAEWMGLMGSGGGTGNASTPLGLVVLLTPSLFLGPSFLVLIVSIHQLSSPDRRVWSHAAVAFATVYTVLIGINYFVQLTWVAPRLAAGRTQGIEPFLFTPFDSFLYAVDILGYSFMSLATLFSAAVRVFLTANGFLLPFIALADVRPFADMDSRALCDNLSGVNVVAGNLYSADKNDPLRA